MKKFFIKHKFKILLIAAIIVTACSLTAVSIALWNSDTEEEIIYNIPSNPAEKYLDYYAVVKNASSQSGYDYYPTTRVPSGLEIVGYAVSRYDGFASEVEIPSTYNGKEVIHILNKSSDTLSNGFTGNGSPNKIIVPETVTYIAEGAFDSTDKVIIEGGTKYQYLLTLTDSEINILDNSSNVIDKLVRQKDEYYLSLSTYDVYPLTDNNITYTSYYPTISIGGNSFDEPTMVAAKRIKVMGSYDISYIDSVSRENSLTYTLTNPDLFGNVSGYMESIGGDSYQKYVISTGNNTFTFNGDSVVLGLGKYLITYDGSKLELNEPTLITYSVNSVEMILDKEFTDYERYYLDVTLDGNDISVSDSSGVCATLNNTLSGDYRLYYSPDTLFSCDGEITNIALEEYYYLHKGVVSNDTSSKVGFILPSITDVIYVCNVNGNSYTLTNSDNTLYYTELDSDGKVFIEGYVDNKLVYKSHTFDYVLGKKYDLTQDDTLVYEVSKLDNNTSSFDIVLSNSISGINSVGVSISATYIDVLGGYTAKTETLAPINVELTNNRGSLDNSMINNPILANATILSTEYIFTSYVITLNVGGVNIEVYNYSNSNTSASIDLSFYQKEYYISYQESELAFDSHYEFEYVDTLDKNFGNNNVNEYIYHVESSGFYVVSDRNSINGIELNDRYVNASSNQYISLVNGNVSVKDTLDYSITHIGDLSNINGTYLIYDGEYVRLAGNKQYFISVDGANYKEMELVTGNLVFEEYQVTNYSVSTPSNTITIKDDLDNIIYTHELDTPLNVGLYSAISFSLDNHRRKENNYEVLANIKIGDAVSEVVSVTLDGQVYYLDSSDLTLPDYSNVFTLAKGLEFEGWLDSESNLVTVGEENGVYTSKLAMLVSGNGYKVISGGNEVDRLYLGDTFKVNTISGYSDSANVTIDGYLLESIDGVYTVSSLGLFNVEVFANTYRISIDGSAETYDYVYGTEFNVPLPLNSENFIYYYDKTTGIVYTDKTGKLVSPYILTKDVMLTAVYQDEFYVVVNKYLDGVYQGSVILNQEGYASGTMVSDYLPVYDAGVTNYHYSSINAYVSSTGAAVSFDINEFLHRFSFEMPNGNVIINIDYSDTSIDAGEVVKTSGEDLYVLVPVNFANNVKIYDATTASYVSMVRLASDEQIYPGYVLYRSNDYYSKTKILANGYESYPYEINSNLVVIENFSLENELCYQTKWISYTNYQETVESPVENNVFVFDASEFDLDNYEILPIEGMIDVDYDANTITILKATNVFSDSLYQKASFKIIDNSVNIPVSFIISYNSLGTESNPILIYDYEDFESYMTNSRYCYINGLYFKQTEDFDVEDGNGYDAIFSAQRKFNHHYNGYGHNINYQQIDIRDDYSNGLFAYIGSDGSVSNLKIGYSLLNPNNIGGFETKSYIGSVASVNEGEITNVETLLGGVESNNVRYFGGLVGINAGNITECINRFSIVAYDYGVKYSNFIGGIAGFNIGSGVIKDCFNYAEIDCITGTGQTVYWGDITAMTIGDYGNSLISNNSVASAMDEIYIGKANADLGMKYVYYFTNNYTWDQVYAYAWTKTNVKNAAWPGVEIKTKYYGQNDLGQHVYYYATNTKYDYLIFNNNNNEQTENITLSTSDNHANWYLTGNHTNYVWPVGKATAGSNYQVLLNGQSVGNTYKTITGGLDNKEVVAYGVTCKVGDTIEARQDASNPWIGFKVNLGTGCDGAFASEDGKLVCKIAGTYDIYVKLTTNGVTSGSGHTQNKALKTISLTFVDDWWFVKETRVYNGQNYYFESGIKVDTYNSSGVLKGSIVYAYDEIYEYKGMKSVKVQMLADSSGGRIEVSRVMFINNYDGGNDRFYFSFDDVDGFEKIGSEFTSHPENTYKVSISYNLVNNNDQFFIYTTNSQVKYATKAYANNTAAYIYNDLSVVGYIDVFGLEKYDSYRVLYYDEQTVTENSVVKAIRSYKPGEQVELLDGVTAMRFEVVSEGYGTKRIALVKNAGNLLDKSSITFSPVVIDDDDDSNPTYGDYAMLVDGENLVYLTKNTKSATEEYFINGLSLQEGQTFKFVKVNNGIYTDVSDYANDSYSSNKISFNSTTNVYTVLNSFVFDIYYKKGEAESYIGDAKIYDLYYTFSDSSKEYIRLHTNPANNKEVITSSVTANADEKFSIRLIGESSNQIITLNSTDKASLSNNVVTFKENGTYEIKFNTETKVVTVILSTTNNYTHELGTDGNTHYTSDNLITSGNGQVINFVANGYGSGNIYYVDSEDNIIGYYPFSEETNTILCVDNAVKLYVVKEVLINESYVQMYTVRVNAIYPGKTLSITNPYYGYYDARYRSQSDDIVALYFKSNSPNAYFNYELNDGRKGSIMMRNLDGYHSISFETIIGLNPVSVSFTGTTTTNKLSLSDIDIAKNNCYDESLTPLNYENSQKITVYIDSDCSLLDVYYILVDGIYYPMTEVDDRLYEAYVNINDGKTFQITSNHTLNDVIMSSELTYSNAKNVYKIYGIGTNSGDVVINYATISEAINGIYDQEITYTHYLTGSFASGNDNNYGLSLYDGLYYGFIEISEDTKGFVGSYELDLVKGYNIIVYDGTNAPKSYNNELTYEVSFIYGNNVYRKSYLIGSPLELPDFTPVLGESHKYSFTFAGWEYDGVAVEAGIKVVSDMDIYAKFTPVPKQFVITLMFEDQLIDTFNVNFGQRVSNIHEVPSFINPQKPAGEKNAWFAGWFLDKAFDLNASNYIITEDTTLYARWYLEGVFLMGRIEGVTDWNDQRADYRFTYNATKNQEELEYIYLQEGDEVRLYQFFADNGYYSIKQYPTINGGKDKYYLEGTVYSSTDKSIFAVDDDLNVEIKKSGYYDFYLLWKTGDDTNEVHITYREFLVEYDANGGVIDLEQKRFNMVDSYELVNKLDDPKNANAPTGTKDGGYVLYGLFTLPSGGDRVTSLTPNMMGSKNSIKLYAQYIYGGYYLNGSSETDLITTQPKVIELAAGESMNIYHYQGSVKGSSALSTIGGNNNVTFDGNTVTATLAGKYKVYLDNEGNLTIDQYHDITYILGPVSTYDNTSTKVVVTDCLYGSNLLESNQLVVNGTLFEGWMENPATDTVYRTTVDGNKTYYAVYVIGSN